MLALVQGLQKDAAALDKLLTKSGQVDLPDPNTTNPPQILKAYQRARLQLKKVQDALPGLESAVEEIAAPKKKTASTR